DGIVILSCPGEKLNSRAKGSKPKLLTLMVKASDLTLLNINIPAGEALVPNVSLFPSNCTEAPATTLDSLSRNMPCTVLPVCAIALEADNHTAKPQIIVKKLFIYF